ncbi:MAG: RpiB/LacA/LacB family sugar-phosphate isomerase, partial [Deltaproteobacteria bacterium]|nr:RpiB/LacA/LacB family sugar-phosphate isomerase [Deltaproteobacteria bacterium]
MKVAIGADHAGCALKRALADHLRSRGHEVADLGTDDPGRSVDYPDFAFAVARAVGSGEADLGG